jgi:hypothetical protein
VYTIREEALGQLPVLTGHRRRQPTPAVAVDPVVLEDNTQYREEVGLDMEGLGPEDKLRDSHQLGTAADFLGRKAVTDSLTCNMSKSYRRKKLSPQQSKNRICPVTRQEFNQ